MSKAIDLYLKPFSVPQYQYSKIAQFLVQNKRFKTINSAINYILYLEQFKPWEFKALVSEYYNALDVKPSYTKINQRDVANYKTSPDNYLYGDEPHMFQ